MKTKSIISLLAVSVLSVACTSVNNQSANTVSKADTVSRTECTNPNAIGVERTIYIDKTPGQKYGHAQYGGLPLNPKEVVLTFDDGPVPNSTPKILDVLRAECTKATFFMVGNNLEANPNIAKAVIAGGNSAGIHSYKHDHLNTLSAEEQKIDLEKTISIAQNTLGKDFAPFYRFPFLEEAAPTTELLKEKGFAIFSIDAGITDWEPSTEDQLNTRLLDGLKANNGGIILMHDYQMQTANALPKMLNSLKSNGYKVVFVDFKKD